MNYNIVRLVGTYDAVEIHGSGLYSSELTDAIEYIYKNNKSIDLFVSEEKYDPKWIYCGCFSRDKIEVALKVANAMIELFKRDVENYRNEKIKNLEEKLNECYEEDCC